MEAGNKMELEDGRIESNNVLSSPLVKCFQHTETTSSLGVLTKLIVLLAIRKKVEWSSF